MALSTGAKRGELGYTLIELMITVAVVAILARIAIPTYRDYVKRGQLIAGTNALLQTRVLMEQYYQDNRTYVSTGTTCGATMPTNVANFSVTCSAPTTTTYTLTATGSGTVAGFTYTIDQQGNQQTTSQSWGTVDSGTYSCWLIKRNQTC